MPWHEQFKTNNLRPAAVTILVVLALHISLYTSPKFCLQSSSLIYSPEVLFINENRKNSIHIKHCHGRIRQIFCNIYTVLIQVMELNCLWHYFRKVLKKTKRAQFLVSQVCFFNRHTEWSIYLGRIIFVK